MPRAKREREVPLTKVKKKTRESKENLVEQIKSAVEKYARLFVFDFENLRSAKFIEIRQQFKSDSQFFLGKKKVMAIALGRTPDAEVADDLHKVSEALVGQCGLLFTNKKKSEIVQFFREYEAEDFPRSGTIAEYTVQLPAGPLKQFAHSIEPQLRALGLPTKMEKGVVELYSEYKVCETGDKLTPEQCKILKLLGERMTQFRVNLIAHWSNKTGFQKFMLKKPIGWLSRVVVRTYATKKAPQKELSFSESGAYFGVDKKVKSSKSIYDSLEPLYTPSYFDSPKFTNKRAALAIGSVVIFFVYFGLIRETNDIDVILNAPAHLLSSNLERRMLREQIAIAEQAGRSTDLLQAQLDYVDVKEAAIKSQNAKKKL
ncbi:Ribosome assembly factor mrt4 [Aphelenchoides besseyi]|nr:Ribosome assembly factor mrt4 [Aphelenchoides besseyi]KAI6232470.1 Ribosome assembly factor mrt4 [Aphelenchoides besseyi]